MSGPSKEVYKVGHLTQQEVGRMDMILHLARPMEFTLVHLRSIPITEIILMA